MSIFSKVKSVAKKVVSNIAKGATAFGKTVASIGKGSSFANTAGGAGIFTAPTANKTLSPGSSKPSTGGSGPVASSPRTISSGSVPNRNMTYVPNMTTITGQPGQGQKGGSVIVLNPKGQATGGIISPTGVGYTSVNSYGGLTPTTLAGGQKLATSTSPLTTSAGEEDMTVQDFRPNTDGDTFGTLNSTSISSPAASVSLPSAPGYSDPGTINNAGLVNMLSETKQFNPETGMFLDVPQDPIQQDESRRNKEFIDLLELIPKKDTVANDPDVQRQEAEVRARRQELNNYTAQLNSVVAKQNADLLTLRGIGAQEGVTEVVYGGQAATINREAAIKALPIQAQISAAQGNLELAQDYLTDLKKIKQEAIDADYGYNMKKFEAISGFVTGEQKIRLEKLKETEKRAYDATTKNLEDQRKWMTYAAENGRPDLIARIGAVNVASPDYEKEKSEIVSRIVNLDANKKVADANESETTVELTSPQKTRLDALNTVTAQLENYTSLIEQYTGRTGAQLTGKQAAQLRTAKSALEFAIASAVGTGALQAADRAVVQDLLPDPTSISGAIGGAIRGGKSGNLAALAEAKKIFDSARQTLVSGAPASLSDSSTSSGSVKIGGQDVKVGSIIENSKGQRARVNADGTVTPL